MKQITVIVLIAAFVFLLSSCYSVPFDNESSAEESPDLSQMHEESSDISFESEASDDESDESKAYEESETSEPSQTSEESEVYDESEVPDESEVYDESEASEASETSEDEVNVLGSLFAPYMSIIESGEYVRKTAETRLVGGEAPPYIVTSHHSKGVVYAVVNESYGSESVYLIKDGKLIILDTFQKIAYVSDFDENDGVEKKLWTGKIALKKQGKQTLLGNNYDFEAYADSTGFEFKLFFADGILKKYLYYDDNVRDTVAITFEIENGSGDAFFDIPEGYRIING